MANRIIGYRQLAAIMLAGWLATSVHETYAHPSFSCYPAPKDALAKLSCTDGELGEADLRMVQAYYALRASMNDEQRAVLKTQVLQSVASIPARCSLPPVEPQRDQGRDALSTDAAGCVAAAYGRMRDGWTARLTGPAAEEASRPGDRNVEIQRKLQVLGFIPGKTVDGVFGTVTREGITDWQRSEGRPATGFLDDADAANAPAQLPCGLSSR